MRTRLPGNPQHDYQVARDNNTWPDHVLRYLATAAAIAWLRPDSVCDPACGDGSVVSTLNMLMPVRAYLSDISQPSIDALRESHSRSVVCMDATERLVTLPETVDVVILTEFLEHIEDPDAMLRVARSRANHLVASSPVSEAGGNPEHLWSWDTDGYRTMLIATGWEPVSLQLVSFETFPYTFQIWTAK